jgi:hypothetical protein
MIKPRYRLRAKRSYELCISEKGGAQLGRNRPKKKPRPLPKKPIEPRQVSQELQTEIDHFAKALGHLIVMKIDPEAARRMAEDGS